VVTPGGDLRHALESTGPPLGILEDAGYTSSGELPLRDGELMLLLTDGAAEAQNEDGEFFEVERVLQVIAEAREECSRRIVDRLRDAIGAFAPEGPQRDDITAVVCKVGSEVG
jgi:serine phosphatase RsbU (regulator of sigma subunit)